MGRELGEQAEMLDDTDRLADRVGGRLQGGLKKMGEVVRRNEDGLSSCCIGVLIFVLILLLILVLVL
jgi:t-SNARE syntaxin family protein